jgi:phage terminase small subunit
MTGKQAAFIRFYLESGMNNAADAYRKAYNCKPTTSIQAISKNAGRLLENAQLAPVLADARRKLEEATAKAAAQYVVTKDRISHALACMAFADPRTFYDWEAAGMTLKPSADLTDNQAAAVQSVSSSVTKYGRSLKVELADRRGALMDLAKLHGHIVERKDVRVIRNLEDLSEAELMALAGETGPVVDPNALTTKH